MPAESLLLFVEQSLWNRNLKTEIQSLMSPLLSNTFWKSWFTELRNCPKYYERYYYANEEDTNEDSKGLLS